MKEESRMLKCLENMHKLSEFKFWFKPTQNPSILKIVSIDTQSEVGTYNTITKDMNDLSILPSAELDTSAEMYLTRPEALIGTKVINNQPIKQISMNKLVDNYNSLLAGAILGRSNKSTDAESIAIKRIESTINWLASTDFYRAPASTIYHDACAAGLLYHSLKVYDNIVDLYKLDIFYNKVDLFSATLVALTHDWCKINLYSTELRNRKIPDTGEWTQVEVYTRDQKGVPLGHGTSSMFLTNRCVPLSVEESLAIRWHMGSYNTCPSESFELENANENYPLVRMLQFADQLACVKY